MKLILAALFFITALLYASVGFGGGSTYTALLILFETDYRLIPIIALTCNVLVVTGNTIRYSRNKLINLQKIWPLFILSIPAAWIGGSLHISETLFIGLLWIALLIAGIRLLLETRKADEAADIRPLSKHLAIALGGGIGFYAGLVGIGGGIFLAPILHTLRWAKPKQIAATCSLFILLNSLSGIWGQFAKLQNTSTFSTALDYWPVIPAVLIGGYIGNHLGVFKLSERWVKRLTGALIVLVAVRLMVKWLSLIT